MRILIFVSMLLCSIALQAKPSERLINALIQVESKGNSKAVGDNGKAVGCLQLWTTYVKDASSKKQKFTANDRKDRAKSIAIFKAYMDKYATADRLADIRSTLSWAENRRLSDISDDEIICRMHNGGMGFCYRTTKEWEDHDNNVGRTRRLVNTATYWQRVKSVMEM